MGWVVERHGAIYADEHGWDGDFEALVAGIVADFHAGFRLGRESAWIAEVDGAASAASSAASGTPRPRSCASSWSSRGARGLGIGSRLVEACTSFAADAGYDTIVLWTNDVLVSARRIYEAAGFRLVDEERHHSFGHDLVGQHWELALR